MRFASPLDDAFRNRSHIRVLRALFGLPAGLAVSAREVARRAGVSHPTASNVLSFLTDQGLVSFKRAPRTDLFQLNPAHTVVERLFPIFEWEQSALAELLSFLREWIEKEAAYIEAAILFGSTARETMTATSDIDVAIVCPADRVEDADAVMERIGEAVRERFGNRLNVIFRPSVGTAREAERRDRLWSQISEEGIPIVSALKAGSIDA